MTSKATVRAGSNIAFIKYWGVADANLNVPLTSSISMTLADAHTTTTVAWDTQDRLVADEIQLDGTMLDESSAARIVQHLDRIRNLVGVSWRARIVSMNNFPMAAGIASSASGFAALTLAACQALNADLDPTQLAVLTRKGSGSAIRSLYGGYVLWNRGSDDTTSVARQFCPPEHWELYDLVAVVSTATKHVSSAGGHTLAATSPLNAGRVRSAEDALPLVQQAVLERILAHLGPHIEMDALAMHGVMMTSTPSLVYWQPGTLEVIQAVRAWRQLHGLSAFFTIDAGPNVHVLCEAEDVHEVERRLQQLSHVQRVIVSRPGSAPRQMEDHLF